MANLKDRLTLMTVLLVLAGSQLSGQGFYVGGHVATSPGITIVQEYTSPGILSVQRDEMSTTFGIGGGVKAGWLFSRSFGAHFGIDWVGHGTTFNGYEQDEGNTFRADIGLRWQPIFDGPLIPYLLAYYGYENMSVKVGDPTIFTGAIHGYSSGIVEWEGSHLAVGAGIELASSVLSEEVNGAWDLHIVVSTVSFDDAKAVTAYRINLGYTWTFAIVGRAPDNDTN